MPDRVLRAGILESELVDKLDFGAEVFYRRLMNRVDDFGRFSADPVILRAQLYPRRVTEVTIEQIDAWLDDCCAAGLTERYEVDNKKYLIFFKMGEPRAKNSKFPAPPSPTSASACMHVQESVPYSDAYANAYSESNATRRGAARRKSSQTEPPESGRQGNPEMPGTTPLAGNSDSPEPTPAHASNGNPEAPGPMPAPIGMLAKAAHSAIRRLRRWSNCDLDLARRVAEAAQAVYPPITAEELAHIIPLAERDYQQKVSLFVRTVPHEIRKRLTEESD